MIGTSPMLQPRRDASNSVSTMNAYPSETSFWSGTRDSASRVQQRKPLVQSLGESLVTVRMYRLANVLRMMRWSGQLTTLIPCR